MNSAMFMKSAGLFSDSQSPFKFMNTLPVYCFGISYRTADERIRSRISVAPADIPALVKKFTGETEIDGAVVLSTCNRTEIYFTDREPESVSGESEKNERIQNIFSRLDSALCSFTHTDIHEIRRYLRYYSGISAVEHLLNVATSLDSLNLGENEILGQLNRAYTLAHNAGFTDFYLNQMFQQAQHYAKKIRVRAGFSNTAVSYSTLVCNEITTFMSANGITSPHIMLIGATGQLGSTILKTLKNRNFGEITVTSRNHQDSGEQLCGNEKTIPYGERYGHLRTTDVLISVTSSPHYTVTYNECLRELASGKPYLFIDLCVPRDIDPDLGKTDRLTLRDFSYFAGIIEKHRRLRSSKAVEVAGDVRTGAMEIHNYISKKIRRRKSGRIASAYVMENRCGSHASVLNGHTGSSFTGQQQTEV